MQDGLPALAGPLGAAYVIPVIYVPALMITHLAASYLLVRPTPGSRTKVMKSVFTGVSPAAR